MTSAPSCRTTLGLGGVGDTGEHARHRVDVPICAVAKSPVARARSTLNGVKSDATVKFGGLIGRKRNPIIDAQEETQMHPALRAVLAIAIVAPLTPQAAAQPRAKADPDWPCQQIKTPTFSLASVWAGPQLDLNSQTWRNESDVADLAAKMAQRRVPIADVESAITDFKAKAGPDADAKLLRAFAAAFEDLSRQRSQIIDGLDRFGHKQKRSSRPHSRGERGRSKICGPESDGQTPPGGDSQERLQWDIRIFDDRRQTITYVCEAPTLIEQRIGEIARAVQKAL